MEVGHAGGGQNHTGASDRARNLEKSRCGLIPRESPSIQSVISQAFSRNLEGAG